MTPVEVIWRDPRVAAGMRRQLELRQQRLAEGESALGWKLAFGAPAVLRELDLTGPLVGFLASGTEREDGSSISLQGWQKPAFEAEIAVHLGADLGAGATAEQAEAAIAGLGMAIELADINVPRSELVELIAGDIYHRHVILGPLARSRAGGRTDGLEARVWRNGEPEAHCPDPAASVGDFVDLTRHTADFLAGLGQGLAAGEVLITGSVVPLIWVEPGDELRFEVPTIGRLEVSFSS